MSYEPTKPLCIVLKTSNMHGFTGPSASLPNKNFNFHLRSPDCAQQACGDTKDRVIKRDYNPPTALATEGQPWPPISSRLCFSRQPICARATYPSPR